MSDPEQFAQTITGTDVLLLKPTNLDGSTLPLPSDSPQPPTIETSEQPLDPLAEQLLPPGPQRRNELAAFLGLTIGETVRQVRAIQEKFPELFATDTEGALLCEPPVASIIRERIASRVERQNGSETIEATARASVSDGEARKVKRAIEQFNDFGDELRAGETLDAQVFSQLVTVLGAESALDVLYRFRPDSRVVPMPIVRSFLADYLGEFVIRPGTLDWNNLGECLPYLDDTKLQTMLASVIKRECLRHYNRKKGNSPDQDDFNILADYLAEISAQFEDLKDANLNAVMHSVNDYYEEVFFFDTPTNMVDSLKRGRTFPDLNQRVDVYESLQEKRFLLANAPGMGKSASAIMTKELSGSKLALILTPSAVFEKGVWQEYLSSKIGVRGKQLGYFKPGQEPRVLAVRSVEDLRDLNPDDYDYIVMSSERVDRDNYFDAIKIVDYDMLIVDEAHDFKNIVEGKRAANLIELSEKLGPEDFLLMLSATPAPNKVEDIALTLRLMYPEKFRNHTNADLVQTIIRGDLLEIRSLLIPKMQAKNYEDGNIVNVTPEQFIETELEDAHRRAYEVILDDWEMEPREKLQILRQILLNPAILDGTPDATSVKLKQIRADLDELFLTKKKVVMFVNGYVTNVIAPSQEANVPDITIMDELAIPGVNVRVIHGDIRVGKARDDILDEFQASKQPMLLIVSGSTIGVGIDLSAADAAIEYNEPWTVAEKTQQYGRAERPGRLGKLDKKTHIFIGTVEEGIHRYINAKNVAINKLMYGVPLTEAEQALVKTAEKGEAEGFELNPELAQFYYSSIDRMNKIFGRVKEIGEDDFRDFLEANDRRYAKEYAATYQDLTTRSYQANSSRMAATIIDQLESERDTIEPNKDLVIVDIGSGPEMLRRHIPEYLADKVVSMDINEEHFKKAKGKTAVGTMRDTKLLEGSVDYANLSLALHYTAWRPRTNNFERLEALAELNRVLKVGGSGIIAMPYSLNLRDAAAFEETVNRLGFAVVGQYSGNVTSGPHFRSQVITLKKVKTVQVSDPRQFVMAHDDRTRSRIIDSLRMRKNENRLRDQRLIAQSYTFEESDKVLRAQLNDDDRQVLDEEQAVLSTMIALRAATETARIVDIPAAELLKRNFSRIWNGKKYLLFKHLKAGGGAVTYRD